MTEACMFNIMELPESDLKRVLPKASTRSLARLVIAYPRSVGKTFLSLLAECVSPVTMEFLHEELSMSRLPSFYEIRQAECELMQIIHEENLAVAVETVNA